MHSRRLLAFSAALLAVACASHGTAATAGPSDPPAGADADATIAKLSERTDRLPSFALRYAVKYPNAEQQIELRFLAPDLARLVVTDASFVQSTWIHAGAMSLRGEDHGTPIVAEISFAKLNEEEAAFDAALERDFHGSTEEEAGGPAGPMFQIELLPPENKDEHGTFSVTVAWYPHALHRFSWLQHRGATNPWRSEEGELAHDFAGGGTIRISKETGFVTRMSHPAGFEFRLVDATADVAASDFEVPTAPPGAKDVTPELSWKLQYGITTAHRRSAYAAMLRSWPESGDGPGLDERRTRVFSEVYRPLCRRFDDDVREQYAANVAAFARGLREVSARTDATQEQRADVAAKVARWKDSYEQAVNEYGDRYIAGAKAPDLDGVDPPLQGVTPERLARLLALERAAYTAEFHERVVQPAKVRLDAALQPDAPH